MKRKAPVALPAQDLYVSALFRGRRRYVEATCRRWYILSALHGLIAPDTVLEPYDESLVNKPRAARREWSAGVLAQLDDLKLNYPATVFELHTGDAYRSFGLVAGLQARGAAIQNPTAGMGQGRQLAFYKAARTRTSRA